MEAHTVQITASTLYEAVARGLAAIRRNEWVAGIAQGLNAKAARREKWLTVSAVDLGGERE